MDGKIENIDLKIRACFGLHQFVQKRLGATENDEEEAREYMDGEREVIGNDGQEGPVVANGTPPSVWRDDLAMSAFLDNRP